MTTCSNGQSTPKMLRRILVLLTLCGLLATTACQSPAARGSRDLRCDDGNDCGLARDDGPARSAAGTRDARKLEEGPFGAVGGRSAEVTPRKKGKDKEGYGKLLLYFIAASKATMLYVMIHAVAAVAGKALIVAKVALAIATAVYLKKAHDHNDKVSYEIVKHPHHSYVQTHSSSVDYDHHGGFGESGYAHRKRRRIHR